MSDEEQEETEKKEEQQGEPKGGIEEPEIPPQHRSNWGLWLLLSVVVGVILLAFVFNDGIGVGSKKMELGEFEKEYRAGNIVLNDPQHFPIEVVSNSGTTAGKQEVKKALRSVVWIKYKIKDKEVFDKAYNYIEQYY